MQEPPPEKLLHGWSLYDPDLLSGTPDNYVVKQWKENKHNENIYWLLSFRITGSDNCLGFETQVSINAQPKMAWEE